ncbi:MAG: hypothetical protein R3B95_06930 [Nitrospirales bacterium]|nr:hypothetical protein [Nitrospirales bacterium]
MNPNRITCLTKKHGILLLCVVWTMSIMSGCAVVLLGAGRGPVLQAPLM